MSTDKNEKIPFYPWDFVCLLLSILCIFGALAAGIKSTFLMLIIFLITMGIFEIIIHAAFSKQIEKYKQKAYLKEKEKEKERKATEEKEIAALTLKPKEQQFYNKFMTILKTLSEEQFNSICWYRSKIPSDMNTILYAELKALSDFAIAKNFSNQGNEKNYEALIKYYEALFNAAKMSIDYKCNEEIEGPGFGIISTSVADTLLYGAIAHNDIKKQARKIDRNARIIFERLLELERTNLFNQTKV